MDKFIQIDPNRKQNKFLHNLKIGCFFFFVAKAIMRELIQTYA